MIANPVSLALVLLLALCSRPTTGQDCSAQCQCTEPAPRCPAGVSLVLDGCGCCRVCAKQLGELCTERDPCDPHKGLYCDFGSPANRKIGMCTAKDGAPCVFGGSVYRSGESFQSSCKYQCTCLDGAVGCVPLCSMDVRLPSPDCPFPRRVKLPGKCCEEWVCDEPKDRTVVGPALAAYRLEDTFGPDPTMMRANCLVQTTEWSACSKTCGMGISTRVTNDNAFCRLEKQSRLCMVRPCEADLEENIKKGKKCIRDPAVQMLKEFLEDDDPSQYLLPPKLLLRYALLLDIVRPTSRRSMCFTKGYGSYIEGTGSVLQTAEDVQIENVFKSLNNLPPEEKIAKLSTLKLRYFTPREIANLQGFPPEFEFPEKITVKQRYRLLGNSLNVHVVAKLLTVLCESFGSSSSSRQ